MLGALGVIAALFYLYCCSIYSWVFCEYSPSIRVLQYSGVMDAGVEIVHIWGCNAVYGFWERFLGVLVRIRGERGFGEGEKSK